MDGYMVTQDDEKVASTEKVADVEGLENDESMTIEEIDPEDEEDTVEDMKAKGLTVDSMFEITIRRNGGAVSTSTNTITFRADVPSEPAEGYTREWFLYYIHDGELKQNTTLKVENGKFSWEAKEFSIYIFAYKDTVIPDAPDTGNFVEEAGSVSTSISIAATVSAITCAIACIVKRAFRR